jgi:hypothetical protein
MRYELTSKLSCTIRKWALFSVIGGNGRCFSTPLCRVQIEEEHKMGCFDQWNLLNQQRCCAKVLWQVDFLDYFETTRMVFEMDPKPLSPIMIYTVQVNPAGLPVNRGARPFYLHEVTQDREQKGIICGLMSDFDE